MTQLPSEQQAMVQALGERILPQLRAIVDHLPAGERAELERIAQELQGDTQGFGEIVDWHDQLVSHTQWSRGETVAAAGGFAAGTFYMGVAVLLLLL